MSGAKYGSFDHVQLRSDIGHNGFPVSINYFTALPDPNNLLLNTNAAITVIIKSLMKKDATTKEKSLAELVQLFETPQFSPDLKSDSVIQSWIQIYPKLAFDNSRAVRLLAQNVQAKFLDHVGGKGFSKYLKSSLPIWLLSNYDSDKTVANNGYKLLCECFQNDKPKVDKRIWEIFVKEILHYIVVSLTLESKSTLSDERNTTDSDAVAKHERIMSGSLMLLNKLITLVNDSEANLSIDEYGFEQIESLLDNNVLWDYMTVVFTPKTFNSGMATSYLLLLRAIFQEDKQNKGTQNRLCQSISSSRSIYKHISKRFIKEIKIKPSKVPTNNIIYGSIILQFWGTLTVMTRFPLLEGKKKPKEGIWELGGSKSENRLVDYISLGPCNLDSVYYILLGRFLTIFVENSSLKDALLYETIVNVIGDQLPLLKGYSYKHAAIECLFEFIKVLPESGEKFLVPLIPKLLATLKITRGPDMDKRGKCIAMISELLNDFSVDNLSLVLYEKLVGYVKSGEKLDVNTYFEILNHVNNNKQLTSKIVEETFDLLAETEDTLTINRSFEVLMSVLELRLPLSKTCEERVVEFTSNIDAYLESDTASLVSSYLFRVFQDSRFDASLNTFELIDDILTKFDMIDADSSTFVKQILKNLHFEYEDCLKSELLAEKLDGMAEKPLKLSDDWDILFHFITSSNKLFVEVLKHLDESQELEFLQKFNNVQCGSSKISKNINVIEKIDRLLVLSWENFESSKAFISIIESLPSFEQQVQNSLWKFIKYYNFKGPDLDSLWNEIGPVKQEFIMDRLDQELTSLNGMNKDALAISNSLGANIYLVAEDNGELSTSDGLLGLCKFFAGNGIRSMKLKAGYYCGILNQFLQDYIFLQNQTDISEELIQIQEKLYQKFINLLDGIDLETVLKLEDNSSDDNIANALWTHFNNVKGCYLSYISRLLKIILEEVSTSVTPKQFDSVNFDVNPLLKQPLKLSIVLSGLNSLLRSQKFDRIRNFVVAEILGVKSDQILTEGLKWVVLSMNFLQGLEDFEAIPGRRMDMILLQFEKWLDSDVCYEDAFITVRSQMMKFLTLIPSGGNEKRQELLDRLVEDNLSIIQVERNFELRYFTLKYLSTQQDLNSNDSVKEELLNMVLNDDINNADTEINNMAINLCQDVLQRCFKNLTFKEISLEQMNKLYNIVISSKNKSYQLKIVCYRLLSSQIVENQQELVIDYQFKRTNEDFNEEEIKIPSQLIDFVSDFQAHEEETEFTYLLCWCLIFEHFKDINYLIRNQYSSQIKNKRLMNKFLEFIFEIVELDNIKVVDNFEELEVFDRHLLMLHVYYLACKYLGSEVQSWYNEMRNIQLKQDIEKFTSKNISKLLITQMISEVETNKSKIITDIMNIKINKVINEIKSSFSIDDQVMEMVIKIPNNFPFNNVQVEGSKRIGLTENEWKAWLLSSQRVISLTNGSIVEAIEVFKKNVDLHFSGFEECAICYSILHQDHSLPSKNCSTCSNKFHAACLYKWFKSSGSSTCPLCRSTFNFRK